MPLGPAVVAVILMEPLPPMVEGARLMPVVLPVCGPAEMLAVGIVLPLAGKVPARRMAALMHTLLHALTLTVVLMTASAGKSAAGWDEQKDGQKYRNGVQSLHDVLLGFHF